KEKLLQIILAGQLNLQTLLRSPELRQLDQRVSIRYELKPLDEETVAAYVAHRLTIAGGGQSVSFMPKALRQVHRRSAGIPRLINLICDRALLTAYSIRATRITRDMVSHAATSLDVPETRVRPLMWLKPRASLVAAAALVVLASAIAVGTSALVYRRFDASVSAAAAEIRSPERLALLKPPSAASVQDGTRAVPTTGTPRVDRHLPVGATMTVLVSSFPLADPSTPADVAALTQWLESSGFPVFYAEVDLGS